MSRGVSRFTIARAVCAVVLAAVMAGCASGSGERRLSDDGERYFDENRSTFDSEVYYDPFYGYRGTGEFRANRKVTPYK